MSDAGASQNPSSASSANADRYFLEFGKFIHEFASVETQVHVLFRRMSGIEYPVAHVISGQMNLGELMTATRRVVRARALGDAVIAEVEAVFSQLTKIASLRNFLVHRGARQEGDTYVASEQFTSKSPDSYRILQFKIDDITAATRDCTVLFMRIYRIWAPTPQDDPFVLRVIGEPWQYQHREPQTVDG